MKITNKKILITGGATGIGFALAERFINDGNTVIICGRREHALTEAKNKLPPLITKVCDLAIDSEREALYKWISENHSDLNILVNNAGIQQWMSISDPNFYQRAKEEISINIEAPVHLAYLFQNLQSLRTIINVTSGLSFVPLTKTPVYSGTKAFLHSFTLSLRHLLIQKNIEVIEMIPPALNTDLGGKGIHDFAPPVSGFIESIFEQIDEGKSELTYGFSEQVSKAGSDVLTPLFDKLNPKS
ncbi:MAG: SDR family oxidoreductase [Chitinophagales bacterium]